MVKLEHCIRVPLPWDSRGPFNFTKYLTTVLCLHMLPSRSCWNVCLLASVYSSAARDPEKARVP